MYRITRKLEFDAAHRVLQHESKCKNLHGHRYTAAVTVTAPGLDTLGRVIDFGVVKYLIGGWIDANWDHNIILNSRDPLAAIRNAVGDSLRDEQGNRIAGIDDLFAWKPPYLIDNKNPTAEVLAEELYWQIGIKLPAPLTLVKIRILETPNCWADFYP